MEQVETILAAIDEYQAKTGESDRAISMAVTGKPDLLRKMRETPRVPKAETLVALAAHVGVPVMNWVGAAAVLTAGDGRLSDKPIAWRDPAGRGDLPILGTALGSDFFNAGNDTAEIEQTIFEPGEVIKYITRPAALVADPFAYAVYIQGDSMSPRYEPGEIAVATTRKPPQHGDDVIVQLLDDKGDGEEDARIISVLIKRLVRRSASWVELKQFNPACTFRVPTDRIKHIHRITHIGDLLGA